MSLEELTHQPLFVLVTGIASFAGLILAVAALIFAWGKYSATADRLREVMERNQGYELRELVREVVKQEATVVKGEESPSEKQVSDQQSTSTGAEGEMMRGALNIDHPMPNQQFREGEVIRVRGRHSLPLNSRLWIVMGDNYGNFYLQNPPVRIDEDGSWNAPNIHLGQGITELRVVKVVAKGDEAFQKKVLNREWGAFTSLPSGTVTLARQELRVQ